MLPLLTTLCATLGLSGGVIAYVQLAPAPEVSAAVTRRPAAQTVPAELKRIQVTVSATGSVMPARQSQLAFRSAGRVDKVLVLPGDAVTEGQPLATLDLKEATVGQTQAQASLDLSKTRLEAARVGARAEDVRAVRQALETAADRLRPPARPSADESVTLLADAVTAAAKTLAPLESGTTTSLGDVTAAQTVLDDARAKLAALPTSTPVASAAPAAPAAPAATPAPAAPAGGTTTLPTSFTRAPAPQSAAATPAAAGAPPAAATLSTEDATRVKTALDRMATQLTQLRDVAIAQAQVAVAQAQVDEGQLGVDNATLVSPFAGIVGAVTAGPGEMVGANAPAVTVLDLRSMRAEVVVGEADVVRIKRGQPVTLSFDAAPGRSVEGQVSLIMPLPKGQATVASYAVQIALQLPPDVMLFPGMAVQAQIVTDAVDGALLVPSRAVRVTSKGTSTVDVLAADGTIFPHTIKTGLTNGSMTQVLEGLYEGDRVVLPLLP